jgi:hypothetical protein
MIGSALTLPDPVRRAELGAFVARVVQLDPAAAVRLQSGTGREITVWASTPFGALATRSVPGKLEPADVAVPAMALLTALTVERAETVDPGAGERWRDELPPATGWSPVGELAAAELAELVEHGLASMRDTEATVPSDELLDRTAITVPDPSGAAVRVPLRCLFALSGLGMLDSAAERVRVSATGSWLRLDSTLGGVVRRRLVSLPLLL